MTIQNLVPPLGAVRRQDPLTVSESSVVRLPVVVADIAPVAARVTSKGVMDFLLPD